MRKIKFSQISLFISMIFSIICLTFYSVNYSIDQIPLGDFRGVILTLSGIIFFYLYSIFFYRLMLVVSPLESGAVKMGSRMESIYHIHLLFFLVIFYPIMKSNLVPVPLMRVMYLLLGAKLGDNTYSGGLIFDPIFVNIGSNSLIGQGALVIPHVLENNNISHHPITLGDNVTIGANAVIQSGVIIEDNALVAIGAVVKKNTHIKAGETWAGIPAKNITKIDIVSIKLAQISDEKIAV